MFPVYSVTYVPGPYPLRDTPPLLPVAEGGYADANHHCELGLGLTQTLADFPPICRLELKQPARLHPSSSNLTCLPNLPFSSLLHYIGDTLH